MADTAHNWTVAVRIEDIPETGRHFDLAPDSNTRAALARAGGIKDLERLSAALDVTREGAGLRVVGIVSARVRQACVVTLDPVDNDVEEVVDLLFLPRDEISGSREDEKERPIELDDSPEPLIGGTIDLGAIATEFLMLGIDPYPRKPGAVFAPPAPGDGEESPFAALAALKEKQGKPR